MNSELIRKLRLEPEFHAIAINPPSDYGIAEELALPQSMLVSSEEELAQREENSCGFALLFVSSLAELEQLAPAVIRVCEEDALFWIAYPKGTSKIKTDINRDTGWVLMLKLGMEGVAMVSMNETWSAMRYRPAGSAKKPRSSSSKQKASSGATAASPSAGKANPAVVSTASLPDMPQALAEALAASPSASVFYDTLTVSMKRDYLKWVLDAKKEETQLKRIAATIEKLELGLKRPTDK
ncbi:YdeI/OmpD-associated family protein [Paenibacillus sp. GCM10027627]|uniref:YdeI/OmpD-associated family protein n=1 Tax=unclassified Paenibacillus TaxID=185978 RepID=UPI003642591B